MSDSLPALRTDLTVIPQTAQGERCVIIKDPIKGGYFRLSELEYQLACCFDGQRGIAEVAKQFKQDTGEDTDAETIGEFHKSLKQMDLTEKSMAEKNVMLMEKRRSEREMKLLNLKGNMMALRLALWDPNRFFDKVVPHIHWLWSAPAVWTMLVTMGVAVVLIALNMSQVVDGMKTVWALDGAHVTKWIATYITVVVCIALHEMGHGMTCKRFGGEVHEIGVLFMLGQPCLYANVDDAWLFPERKHRLYVTMAGIFTEFFIGSICVFIWLLTNRGTFINVVAYQAMAVCAVSTVIFNFNPLMKLDGYYALCDYLETPNLKQLSPDYVKYILKTRLLGMPRDADQENLPDRLKVIYLTYGPFSMFYMMTMMFALYFVIIKGLLTKILGVVGFWIWAWLTGKFVIQYFKKPVIFTRDYIKEKGGWFMTHNYWTMAGLAALCILGLSVTFVIRMTPAVTGTATIEFSKKETVYAPITGKIQSLRQLQTGQWELTLINEELAATLKTQHTDLERLKLDHKTAQTNGDSAGIAAVGRQLENLLTEIRNTRLDIGRLTTTTALSGKPDPWPAELAGKYVQKGQKIMTVYYPNVMNGRIALKEADLKSVHPGQPVRFVAATNRISTIFSGTVTRIIPITDPKKPIRTWPVIVELTNTNQLLQPGMSGEAKLLNPKIPFWSWVEWRVKQSINPDLRLILNSQANNKGVF